MYFLDSVLEDIENEVAAHRPERGGAILGPVGNPVVTKFILDPRGRTSSASYNASAELEQVVQHIERNGEIELKGILHSHPHGMNYPSGQDHRAYADSLRLNPARGTFLAPIVTNTSAVQGRDHEINLTSGKISVYTAVPDGNGGVRVMLTPSKVVPLAEHVRETANVFGGTVTHPPFTSRVSGNIVLTAIVALPDHSELTILANQVYPMLPPTVLLTPPDGSTETVSLNWQPGQRLAPTLVRVLRPPTHASSVSRDGNTSTDAESVRNGLLSRTGQLLSRSLRGRRVLLAGAGSVGSVLAELLVRSGVEHLTVVDPDTVSAANLSRSVYRLSDVGKPKSTALADHLCGIQPAANIRALPSTVDALAGELADIVREHDLILGCTDDPSAQATLNQHAYAADKPALYVGLYAGANGGELIYTVPGITSCYRCATSVRHVDPSVRPSTDYGTGRLAGEIALGPDIAHVTTAAAKVALALLHLTEKDAPAREFLWKALLARWNYVLLGNVSDFWFFPDEFRNVKNQHAYQSLWMEAERDLSCLVCGDVPAEPVATPAPTPEDLRTALAAADGSQSTEQPGSSRTPGVGSPGEDVA